MKRNWKYLLAIVFTVVSVFFVPVVYAKDNPPGEEISTVENQFVEDETLQTILKKKNPYQALGELEEKKLFFQKLTEKESYQLVILLKYFYVNEMVSIPYQSLDTYVEAAENWKSKKTADLDEEILENWEKEAFDLTLEKESISQKDEEERDIRDFDSYVEFLQTQKEFSVVDCLEFLEKIADARNEEELLSAKEAFMNFTAEDETAEKEITKENTKESTHEEDSIKPKIVTAFDDIRMEEMKPYKKLNIVESEREKVLEILDQVLKVTLEDGTHQDLAITWKCDEDIMQSESMIYTYEVVFPEGYMLSEELLEEIRLGKKCLPQIEVCVERLRERGAMNGTPLLKKDGTGGKYWWVFVRVENPTVTPVLAYRATGAANTKFVSMNKGDWVQEGTVYNYAYAMPAIDRYYGSYTYNVSVEGRYSGAKQFVFGSTRIDGNYYWDLQQAIDSSYAGASIYILRDCTYNSMLFIQNKNIKIYPESGDVTLTSNVWGAASITVEHSAVIFGGNGNSRLNLDGNLKQVGKEGGIVHITAPGGSTVNFTSGVNIYNSGVNGIVCETGNTVNIGSGVRIYDNKATGIVSGGVLNVSGGEFYKNAQDGITMLSKAGTRLNLSAGNLYGNGRAGVAFGGIDYEYKGFTSYAVLSGGSIYNNGIGVYLNMSTDNNWNVTAAGGSIYQNTNYSAPGIVGTGGGVRVNKRCTFNLSGADICSNYAARAGGGIYNNGTVNVLDGTISGNQSALGSGVANFGFFHLSGRGKVDVGNDVYLARETYINIPAPSSADGILAKITPADYSNGRRVVQVSYGNQKGSSYDSRFQLTMKAAYCLRPGDYQEPAALTGKSSIVISTKYSISYHQNSDETVSNIPENGYKYWYEKSAISGNIPQWNIMKFKGWALNESADKETYKPSDEIAASVNKNLNLYAVWDEPPRIQAEEKEFYEGETVSQKDLMQNVIAKDAEDGIITNRVKITKIQYADGRLVDGIKQKGTVKIWKDGMTEGETLDTWFLQLDRNDSPAVHTVTYEVTDSAGSTITKNCDIKVHYNEIPQIQAIDRNFTLEEAKHGMITEDALLHQAVISGKLSASDEEDGNLSEKITLLNFQASDFKNFREPGNVTLTYHVQDSMGPDGKGKETTKQVTLSIIEDGLVPETTSEQWVRFINKKYYDLNKDVHPEDLTDEQKEEYNSNGGLNVESKWYHNPEYIQLIEETWEKENGQIYEYTKDEVDKIKEFVEVHGIGNVQEDNALKEFAAQFMR